METRSRQGPHARAGCVPLLQRRRVRVLVAGALVALDRPDSPRQTSEAERLAHAVIRCRTVDGATRAQVRRLLGGAQRDMRRTWEWFVGETNDALGPGDAQGFYIEFGSDGRARKAYLSPP